MKFELPKNISNLLSCMIIMGYILLAIICTILKIESPTFRDFSMLTMLVAGYYWGDSNKNGKE